MTVTKTVNFKLNLIGLDTNPWHVFDNDNMRLIDALLAKFIAVANVQGVWKNATAVTVDEVFADEDQGTLWKVLVAHTTASTGTFAADRAANPLNWVSFSTDVAFRGAWVTGTAYASNQFVTDSNRYGVCTGAFTSSASYDDDVTAGNIITLIDLSTDLAAAAASAAAAAASAASVSLPAIVALAYLRGNSGGAAWETRTPAQVLSDIGAQATDADLDSLSGIGITAAGLALLDDANAAAQRTTLGLGDAATKTVGVANGNVPVMDTTGYPAADGSQITGINPFAAGTVMVFAQTAAPTGWTKLVTHNDKALRVVTGTASSGGATAFTSVFGSGISTDGFTLTATEMPSHSHTAATSSADSVSTSGGGQISASGSTGAAGGDGSHAHTMSMDLQYVDVILASKDA